LGVRELFGWCERASSLRACVPRSCGVPLAGRVLCQPVACARAGLALCGGCADGCVTVILITLHQCVRVCAWGEVITDGALTGVCAALLLIGEKKTVCVCVCVCHTVLLSGWSTFFYYYYC
jgi:hypothetical protein